MPSVVQCIIRDNKLQMKVVFRSNDMLTAAGANMFALVHLQKYIADQLGVAGRHPTRISRSCPISTINGTSTDIEPFCRSARAYHARSREVCDVCREMPGIPSETANQSTLLVYGRQQNRRTQPGSVAVNHPRLWISRQQFESAPGYSFCGEY